MPVARCLLLSITLIRISSTVTGFAAPVDSTHEPGIRIGSRQVCAGGGVVTFIYDLCRSCTYVTRYHSHLFFFFYIQVSRELNC